MNDKGEIVGQKKLPSNGEVVEFLKEFEERMEVAIEATPSWYWLYELLEDGGFDDDHGNKNSDWLGHETGKDSVQHK